MLYLIQSPTWGTRKSLMKVGYTSDLETRFTQYTLHNPSTLFLGTRQGEREHEALLHLALRSQGLKAPYLEEWFLGDPKVPEIFHWPWERLERLVWRSRRDLLYSRGIQREGITWDLWKKLMGRYGKKSYLDSLFFSSSLYRKFPKAVVDSLMSDLLRIMDFDTRVQRYQDFCQSWESCQEVMHELESRKGKQLLDIQRAII